MTRLELGSTTLHIVILLLLFGAKRLPEMRRSLGTGLRGFKASLSGEHEPAPAEELAPAREDPPRVG